MATRYEPNALLRKVAFFISPHGFGHAARAASVMEALAEVEPSIQFDIFTTVPDWFFAQSNTFHFHYHRLRTDIGLVQLTPFQEDLSATIQNLQRFLPFDHSQIDAYAQKIRHLKCQLVICDIAPMGIRVAKAAGVPSVLIENFTWDWIYKGYEEKALNEFIVYLQSIFAEATCHIQTQPICKPAAADFTAGPASRKIKTPAVEIRRRLRLSDSCNVVMITAGGIAKNYDFEDRLRKRTDTHFIIPGTVQNERLQDNLILLPENSAYFHPDLINAVDAVIGKVGYGTLAEIYQAGVPFGYCARTRYRESKPLVDFIENNMHGFAISESEFCSGTWTTRLKHLLAFPRTERNIPNGACQMAEFIHHRFAK
jgi:hypothetical protein